MSDTIPYHPGAAASTNADETVPFVPGKEVPTTDLPVMTISAKEELPNSMQSPFRQHVVVAADKSGSMSGPKIAELNLAIQALVQELADPANKDGFDISVIFFNGSADRVVFNERATKVSVPAARSGGGTNIESAVKQAASTVTEFANLPNPDGFRHHHPVAIVMSDGHSSISDQACDELKEVADTIAVAFGSGADKHLLSRIASDGTVEEIGTRGDELRKFFANVGKTLSQVHQSRRI